MIPARPLRIAAVIVAGVPGLVGLPSSSARSAGVFEDARSEAGFLLAPHRNAVAARLITTDAPRVRASVVVMGARFRVSPWLLVEIEQPFVTASSDADGVVTGFGDLRFRSRITLRDWGRGRLSLLPALGTGSGTTDVFPYASQALEMGAALAWNDTLAFGEFWASAGGVVVRREAESTLPEMRHAGFYRVTAGFGRSVGDASLRAGAEWLAFDTGFGRGIAFGEVSWLVGGRMAMSASASLESGASPVRVTRAAVSAGLVVSF